MNLLSIPRRIRSKIKTHLQQRLLQERVRPTRAVLTSAQRAFWNENGYLVLPGHFSPHTMAKINTYIDDLWRASPSERGSAVIDIFIDTLQERRLLLSDAPPEAQRRPYKLNDLHLESEQIRSVSLDTRLCLALEDLLGAPPLLCNTLNLEFGSQQALHTDSLYMAAPVGLNLLATWVALEDAVLEAGPLRYYPGSHTIPPYRFSHGGLHAVGAEMDQYRAYMDSEIDRRGLHLERFAAKQGDVFIWHSQLYHGGDKIQDLSLTRRSLISHYWRACDLPGDHVRVGAGRYYGNRPPQLGWQPQ